MGSVWFDGADDLNRLSADLRGASDRVGRAAQQVIRKTTLDVERDAKAFAPVDTGMLRSSIGHSDLRRIGQYGVLEAEIGPSASYGAFVEFGTSRQAPQAYMGPALDRNAPAFVAAMEQLAGEVLP
nr:HK97-gp10 family putative phage morphogenesis protein [uncultured Actinotalea sp.]